MFQGPFPAPLTLRWRHALALGLALLTGPASAAPLASPSDPVLRARLTRLADQGCLATPVTTWPVSWASVEIRKQASCPHRGRRIQALREKALAPGGRAGLRLSAANQPPILRDRYTPAREEGEIQAGLAWQAERWAGRVSATRVHDPTDHRQWRADGSYVLGHAGGWLLGAGAVDRWWGPGRHSNLIWSNNARPVPGVWLSRNRTHRPGADWLAWIGPWDLTLFAGRLEEDRAVAGAKFLAGRLVFRPRTGLEIGLSRAAQWGGGDRPETLDTFVNMLVGRDNARSSGLDEGEDPGNQRAGLDFRQGLELAAGHTLGVYGQMIGEDEAGYLPSKLNWMAGADWQFRHPAGQGLVYLEATDTAAGSLSGTPRYNIAFEHGIYRSGWRYRRRPLASTFGGDTRAATLGARTVKPDGVTLGVHLSRASFNRDARLPRFAGTAPLEPLRDRTLWLAGLDYRRPLAGGEFQAGLQWSEEAVPWLDARQRMTVTLGWKRTWRF